MNAREKITVQTRQHPHELHAAGLHRGLPDLVRADDRRPDPLYCLHLFGSVIWSNGRPPEGWNSNCDGIGTNCGVLRSTVSLSQ